MRSSTNWWRAVSPVAIANRITLPGNNTTSIHAQNADAPSRCIPMDASVSPRNIIQSTTDPFLGTLPCPTPSCIAASGGRCDKNAESVVLFYDSPHTRRRCQDAYGVACAEGVTRLLAGIPTATTASTPEPQSSRPVLVCLCLCVCNTNTVYPYQSSPC